MNIKIISFNNNKKNLKLHIYDPNNENINMYMHGLINIMMSIIPTYAFRNLYIDISDKSLIDKIKMNLELLPIYKSKNLSNINTSNLEQMYLQLESNYYDNIKNQNKQENIMQSDYSKFDEIKMVINITNNSDIPKYYYTNSNEVKFLLNDVKINGDIYDKPYPIIYLNPGEYLNIICLSEIGIPLYNYKWSPIILRSRSINITNIKSKDNNIDNNSEVVILSRGLYDSDILFNMSINIMIDKLLLIHNKLISKLNDIKNKGVFIIENENFVIVNIIVDEIQNQINKTNDIYIGIKNENILKNSIHIEYEIIKNITEKTATELISNVLKNSIEFLVEKYKKIQELFNKEFNKFISTQIKNK